jgi:hypothetical protein
MKKTAPEPTRKVEGFHPSFTEGRHEDTEDRQAVSTDG